MKVGVHRPAGVGHLKRFQLRAITRGANRSKTNARPTQHTQPAHPARVPFRCRRNPRNQTSYRRRTTSALANYFAILLEKRWTREGARGGKKETRLVWISR